MDLELWVKVTQAVIGATLDRKQKFVLVAILGHWRAGSAVCCVTRETLNIASCLPTRHFADGYRSLVSRGWILETPFRISGNIPGTSTRAISLNVDLILSSLTPVPVTRRRPKKVKVKGDPRGFNKRLVEAKETNDAPPRISDEEIIRQWERKHYRPPTDQERPFIIKMYRAEHPDDVPPVR
ncbi:MAG: hypothetical protein HQL86_08800 [Magnetococcales bacterium]|nr:hypothetical protein [Magnetococcales bacterium]